jgi:glycosyltransferase involved in cell wall biosynthesis
VKLLVTVPWAKRAGGAENLLWTFLRNVDRSRIEPMVVFFEYGSFEREVDALGIRTEVIPAGRLRELGRTTRVVQVLRDVLRTEEPDLVINWSAKTQLYGASAAAAARAADRVVWWQHGIPNGHWLDRLATALPARAIGCCSRQSSEAQARLRPRRPSFVVYPGIETPATTPGGAQLRAQLGLPVDRPVVGIVRAAGHAVHGLIVGGDAFHLSPGYGPYLQGVAVDLGLREDVTFTGQVRDAAPYLAAMDVFVNASTNEPFGIVLLEAMAAGLPIVAFDSGGPREIIEAGRSGLLVADGTNTSLAAAIDTLVIDPELRVRLGAAGRERFHRLFTAERMTRELEERFEDLCR